MDLQLTQKTAFVTGSSGGIGSAIARQFHAEGANVVVHYHSNQTSADQLVTEFGADRSLAVAADLTNESVGIGFMPEHE